MAYSYPNKAVDYSQCRCGNTFENDVYDLQLKTTRSVLNSYKLKWTVGDFSILPISTIKSPVFHPLPHIACHIELEISADDIRIYLCLQEKNFFVNCEFSISDVDGLLLYEKSSTSDGSDRFDVTDVTMRGCFQKLKSTVQDKLIFTFILKIYGAAKTDICGVDDFSYRIDNLKKLSSDLLTAYKNSVNTDIILKTRDGNSIAVHRAVLSARSPVFAKMFEYDTKENIQNKVDITDVAFDILKKLVEFLYSGDLCDLDDLESAYDLYYAADKYNILDLRKLCGDVLLSKLTVDNACRTLAQVDQHEDNNLRAKVIQYICRHLKEIVNSEDWNCYMDNKLSAEVIKMSLV